jgi:hypothetical protein
MGAQAFIVPPSPPPADMPEGPDAPHQCYMIADLTITVIDTVIP